MLRVINSAKEYVPCRKTEWTLLPFRILRWLAREQMLPFLPYMQKKCADVEIMPHVAMRDRNLIGLRSEILGAHVNGIRDFLVITGDPVGSNDRGKITGVFDVNSIRFMEYLKHMNEEVLQEEPVYYGGALNYAGVNPAAIAGRMKKENGSRM